MQLCSLSQKWAEMFENVLIMHFEHKWTFGTCMRVKSLLGFEVRYLELIMSLYRWWYARDSRCLVTPIYINFSITLRKISGYVAGILFKYARVFRFRAMADFRVKLTRVRMSCVLNQERPNISLWKWFFPLMCI